MHFHFPKDPTILKLLFDVAQSLHNNTDFSNTRQDDNQNAEHLAACFVDKVRHDMELDRHLAFLIECLGSINDLKVYIVNTS
ncbi:uncharacterized protein LOC143547700 isoform X3 [Bidens hawaiensis]|uniref:uncharacterized protein LOC143547700 isoform X3 n=1 Tax=Bidens hawaiensis TaxID=980011 RepID=UPI00404B55E5